MIPLKELKIGDIVYTPDPDLRHHEQKIKVLKCEVIEVPSVIEYQNQCRIKPLEIEYNNIRSTGRSLFYDAQECKDYYKNSYTIEEN